jgi:MFS family permease
MWYSHLWRLARSIRFHFALMRSGPPRTIILDGNGRMRLPQDRGLRPGPTAQGGLFYLSYYGAVAAYMPFLSVFYAQQGLSGSEIGWLAGVGPLVGLLGAPALAALADRHGWQVRMLTLGLAGMALCLLALPLFRSFLWLLVVVALLAVVSSPVLSIADGLIAQMAARRALNYGQMRLWGSVSWVVLPPLGGALWQEVGLAWMFPLASVLFLATIPIVRAFEHERLRPTSAAVTPRPAVGDARLRTVLIGSFGVGLGMSMTVTFAAIYLDRLGGQVLVGLFSGVAALSEIPVMLWSERIMRRLGGPRTLLLAYALLGTAYLGLALITQPELLLGVALARGLGFGLLTPTTVRLIAGWAPPGRAATSQALLNSVLWGLAPLIAGPLAGAIYDVRGPGAVFLIATGASVLAGLVLTAAWLGGVFKRTDDPAAPVAVGTGD